MERITKPPAQLRTPSIDFSKPRLVQISVSDAGACMPLIPQVLLPTDDSIVFKILLFAILVIIVIYCISVP